MTAPDEIPVHNPVDAERRIEELANRIARGVSVVTAAEREARARRREADLAYAHAYLNADGPAHERRYAADIASMPAREAAELAELAFRHAERTAKALEKELVAMQSVAASIRTMFASVRA